VAIQAVLVDLDETLWHLHAPPDWNDVSGRQAAALSPECVRLGFGQPDLHAFVRQFWAAFDAALPNPDTRAGAPLAELRWHNGPAMLRRTLNEYGVVCADGDAASLWEALNAVPLRHFNIRLFPDAIATVTSLHAAGYRLAIVTARPLSARTVGRELHDQGLPAVFEAIITSGDVGYRKQHPLLFQSALARLALSPYHALVVGDSYEDDIIPAAQLGMTPVLKLNDREPDERWVLARYQVSSLAALLRLEVLRR
jgi:FMN phosphatase YigB (HAD superfamily)